MDSIARESADGTATPGECDCYFVYIAECADGTYYTGYAADLKSREQTHNDGKGAKYTRSRLPVRIVYSEAFATKSDALKREAAVKRLSREAKRSLIQSGRGAKEALIK